jgi:rhodanese-related sulfurtransferase
MLASPQTVQRAPVSRLVVLGLVILLIGGIAFFVTRTKTEPISLTPTPLPQISVSELASKLVEGERLLILDIRPKSEYLAEHIPDSVSIPYYEINSKDTELALLTDWPTVVVCQNNDCPGIDIANRDLRAIGFSNAFLLEGGIEAYKQDNLTLSTQAKLVQDDLVDLLKSITSTPITVDDLKKRLSDNSVFLIDTRTPFEFVTGFVPGALNIPLHAFAAAQEKDLIPRDKTIVVYDREGNRSRIAAKALTDAGYTDVLDLKGGIEAWLAGKNELSLPAEDGSDLTKLIPVLDT